MHRVDIGNSAGYIFSVKSGECEFSVDMKGEQGVTPPDAFLASLGTCIGVYIRKYVEGAKLDIPEFNIRVEADYDVAKPVCFRKIQVSIDLKGAGLDERRLRAMLEFIKNCSVHNTLKNNPDVEIRIN